MVKKIPFIVTVLVALGSLVVICSGVFLSWQASTPSPMPLGLEDAQFSSDGGITWHSVGDGSALRNQRGDIAIRGHFNHFTREGWILNLYLQHMQMEFFVNGQLQYSFAREFQEIRPEWCADLWVTIRLPDTTPEDVIELRLYSLHQFGVHPDAYNKLLETMMLGEPIHIYQWITEQRIAEPYLGIALIIIGVVMLAISFVALWMKSPLMNVMMYTALASIGEGVFLLAGASEIIHYVNQSVAFFNIGRSVSRMLTVYAFLACMAEVLGPRNKAFARWNACMNGAVSFVFLLLHLAGVAALCETEWLWLFMQLFFLTAGLGLCVHEIVSARRVFWENVRLISFALAYLSIMLDAGNLAFGLYPEFELSRYVCSAVAFGHTAALLVQLPASYAAIKRAEKLSEELHKSRVVLAMSQIRTHFIFNVLNAISGLCKSAPELADAELVRFSRYLRNNIDTMQEDRPIPFEKALSHMHNYVALEQLRFEEKILLDENYEFIDFMIPSLVIQPLVENAIKHGLLPKAEGGVVRVSTRRCGDQVLIEIADNGVGFDTHREIAKTSVGLSNVRFRVEQMMGGLMKVESTPGVGTLVQVWLPVGKEEQASCTLSM